MKHVRMLAVAIAVLFFAASCSKDKGDKPSGGNPSIIAKWNISTILTVEPGADPATYTGKEGDYVEFKADGTMTSVVDIFPQEFQYEIVDAAHIKIDGNVAEIKELTSHKLVILDPPHEGQVETITYTLSK